METKIKIDGDTYRVLSMGVERDGKTFCHLASTTRGQWQRNGFYPKTMLNALLILKKLNLIERATEARFLGRHDGDFFFGLVGGDVCAVDTVLSAVKVGGVVVLRGAA